MEALVIWIIVFIFLFGGSIGYGIIQLIEGRRKHQLDMKDKDLQIERAKADQLREQNRHDELELGEARLEIERFDRRRLGLSPDPAHGTPPATQQDSPPDNTLPRE